MGINRITYEIDRVIQESGVVVSGTDITKMTAKLFHGCACLAREVPETSYDPGTRMPVVTHTPEKKPVSRSVSAKGEYSEDGC